MKETTKAYLDQDVNKVRRKHEKTPSGIAQDKVGSAPLYTGIIPYTSITRAMFEELGPDLAQGTLEPGWKARRDAEAGKIPVHDSILAGGSAMTPKGQKLPQDSPDGKELNKSTNPDKTAVVQAAAWTTDTSEAASDLLLPDRSPLSLEFKTAGGVMTSPIKRNTTKPTRSRPHRQQKARPPRLPTKLGGTTIEEAAGHRWRETPPLLQAPTHPSYSDNRLTKGHEGLELLGNAAANY